MVFKKKQNQVACKEDVNDKVVVKISLITCIPAMAASASVSSTMGA